MKGCCTDHLCKYYSILPATGLLLYSPLIASRLFFFPSWGPSWWEGFLGCRNFSPLASPTQGCRSHPASSPLTISFFLLPYSVLQGFFFALLGPLLVFNWWSLKTAPFVDILFERLLLNEKMLGFLASRGEEFNPRPKMGLDGSELLCNKVLLKYKGERESFWHRHQKGAERVPPC